MRLFLTVLLSLTLVAGSLAAQPAASPQQRAVESNLLPAIVFDRRAEAWTLSQRMARWSVPGVSIAVIDDGRIAWAQGYGVIAAGEAAPVTVHTRFQAASISKPVAAMAAMTLVQDGRLSLDADINTVLKRWKLPPSPLTEGNPVTPRHLLSHSGGTTVHGFPGYAPGRPASHPRPDPRRRAPGQYPRRHLRGQARRPAEILRRRLPDRPADDGGRHRPPLRRYRRRQGPASRRHDRPRLRPPAQGPVRPRPRRRRQAHPRRLAQLSRSRRRRPVDHPH